MAWKWGGGEKVTTLLETMEMTKPTLSRTYGDENALAVIGAVADAIRQVGRACDRSSAEIREASDTVRLEMMSGDNDNLLAVASRYVTFADDGREEDDDDDDW